MKTTLSKSKYVAGSAQKTRSASRVGRTSVRASGEGSGVQAFREVSVGRRTDEVR
jgi:hypothetical protein